MPEFSREYLKTIFARLPPLASAARCGPHPPRTSLATTLPRCSLVLHVAWSYGLVLTLGPTPNPRVVRPIATRGVVTLGPAWPPASLRPFWRHTVARTCLNARICCFSARHAGPYPQIAIEKSSAQLHYLHSAFSRRSSYIASSTVSEFFFSIFTTNWYYFNLVS